MPHNNILEFLRAIVENEEVYEPPYVVVEVDEDNSEDPICFYDRKRRAIRFARKHAKMGKHVRVYYYPDIFTDKLIYEKNFCEKAYKSK